MTDLDLSATLHPVAAERDLVLRHVYQGRLLGQELAIWRADDGHVNVWENRCIHRGVRLSTGMNDGAEVICQYHEWRYSNRSGACSYIPAHPEYSPPRAMGVQTFPCELAYGLVWTGSADDSAPPTIEGLDAGFTTLRGLPVDAPIAQVLELLEQHEFVACDPTGSEVESDREVSVEAPHSVTVRHPAADRQVVYFAQPADANRTVVRPVLAGTAEPGREIDVLRHHATQVEEFRAWAEGRLEAGVTVELPKLRSRNGSNRTAEASGRQAVQELIVTRKWDAADEIAGFELQPRSGELISFQPGAHIDVHLDNGLVRQYSLTNGPHQTDCYRIGVKLEPESRGGSRYMHEKVVEGDVLSVSEPRNNFPLRRDAHETILIAGGIGITPLLAMTQTLARQDLRHQLHYFVRDERQIAFPEILAEVGSGITRHVGLGPDETVSRLSEILGARNTGDHVYICGPGPMLEGARRVATEAGWPDDSVHFEYFANDSVIDDSSTFEVELARTGRTLTVGPGRSLLDALRAAGVPVASSCEQGACGTCVVPVIDGEIDHQDVYLRESERDAGDRIMSCVSRAGSERLVLDL